MESSNIGQASNHALAVFGLFRAPLYSAAAREDAVSVAWDQVLRGSLSKSPRSLLHPLHQALLSARGKIEKLSCENVTLTEENSRLVQEELSMTEALEEQMSLYSQAKKEKEEMEAALKKMEEDFKNKNKMWQTLNKYNLEEIRHFRTDLLVAQTLREHLEQEVRDCKRELHEGRKQVEREITSLEKSLCIQREENAARLPATKSHQREMTRIREEDAATKLRESEEKWQRRVSQMEEEMKEKRSFISSLTDQLMAATGELRNTAILLNRNQSELYQSKMKWESRCSTLEESYRRELTEKEEGSRRKVQEMESKNELQKTRLQKEEECQENTSAPEEAVMPHPESDKKEQGKRKNQKPWWKKRLRFRGRRRSGLSGDTVSLLTQPKEN